MPVPVSPRPPVAQRGLHDPWARRESRRRQPREPRSGRAGHQPRRTAPPAPPQLQRAGSGPACSGEGHGPLPAPAPGSPPWRSHKPDTRTLRAAHEPEIAHGLKKDRGEAPSSSGGRRPLPALPRPRRPPAPLRAAPAAPGCSWRRARRGGHSPPPRGARPGRPAGAGAAAWRPAARKRRRQMTAPPGNGRRWTGIPPPPLSPPAPRQRSSTPPSPASSGPRLPGHPSGRSVRCAWGRVSGCAASCVGALPCSVRNSRETFRYSLRY